MVRDDARVGGQSELAVGDLGHARIDLDDLDLDGPQVGLVLDPPRQRVAAAADDEQPRRLAVRLASSPAIARVKSP